MSYTIEYNRKVYSLPEPPKWSESNYLLLIKQGDNNVYDCTTNRRSRSWDFICYGWEYYLWQKLGARAGSCEGGGLQRAKGWQSAYAVSIEDYIALYRRAIKRAKPLQSIFDDFQSIEFSLSISGKNGDTPAVENIESKYSREELGKYMSENNLSFVDGCWYDEKTISFRHGITTVEQLTKAIGIRNLFYNCGCRVRLHFTEKKKPKRIN